MKRPVLTLVLHAVTLFFLTFLMSGNANVLPQLFFQRYYAEQKVLLLAVSLLLATVAGTLGVLSSRRRRASQGAVLLGLAAVLAAAASLFSLTWHVGYIALTVAIQFGDNYLINQLDHAAVARVDESRRRLNDVLGNVARLLGMLAAPAFFTTFYAQRAVLLAGIGLPGLLALGGAMNLLASAGERERVDAKSAAGEAGRADRLLFGYAVSVYAALYLFAANMIYLLRDLLLYPNAEVRGGRTIVVVFACALAMNAAMAAVRRGTASVRWLQLAAPALVLMVVASLLAAGVRSSFAIFLAGSGAVGAGHGAFLLEIREYTSRAAQQGRTVLLTWFNNTANVSALIAFALMVVLAVLHAPYAWTLWLIALLPAGGLALLMSARRLTGRIQE